MDEHDISQTYGIFVIMPDKACAYIGVATSAVSACVGSMLKKCLQNAMHAPGLKADVLSYLPTYIQAGIAVCVKQVS